MNNTENPLKNTQSHDWNKERLDTLKKLYPDLFVNEGKVDAREIAKLMDYTSIKETERYEFIWFGKSNAKREAFTPTDATLVYDEARSVSPTQSENLIIEGENLEVLKLLSNSYREKVKCIYIDPPYNTGKDFVYSDKFNQDRKAYWEDAETTENGYKVDTNTETDGRFHSNWLNMMYSRLLIARQLLREDGVIFISIDDNEVHHLRKLCDEVFGEENFVGQVSVAKGTTTGQDSNKMGSSIDYLLIYSKNINQFKLIGLPMSDKDKKRFSLEDSKGEYSILQFRKTGTNDRKEDRPNLYYKLIAPDNSEVFPVHPSGYDSCWRTSFEKYKQWNSEGLIVWKKDKSDEYKPYVKYYLEGRTKQISNLWTDIDGNKKASITIRELFEGKIFDFPKPVDLIQRMLQLCMILDNNDIILDFFAGSGTTGQAVTELNQADGGNRKYILVQLPEQTAEKSEAYKAGYKKISDITIERNKRVIEKIKNEELKIKNEGKPNLFSQENSKNKENSKNYGLGFKVFKLQKSNFPRVEFAPDPKRTEEENIELLKKYIKDKEAQLFSLFNKDELITEILIKNGFQLNYTLTKQEEFKENEILFATDGYKETLICLDEEIKNKTVNYFKTNTEQKLIVLERAIDTTKKWNLKHYMGDKFNAF